MNIKIKHVLAYLVLDCVMLVGCQKDELMMWDNRGAIRFENTDTLRFTFAYMENPESDIVSFPMILSGYVTDYDRHVNVQVVSEARDAQTRYEILSSTLEAGQDTAYLQVRVYCTANLQERRDTITFAIVDSEDLLAGDKDMLIHSLTLYNRIEQPEWWNADYFGEFQEVKMEIVNEVFGTTEYFPFDTNMLMEQYPDNFMVEYTYRVGVFKTYVSENHPELVWGPFYDYL